MKNDELLLTVKFEEDDSEITLLMKKDISLKALIEALYYGLRKNDRIHFEMFEKYIKRHTHLIIQYCTKDKGEFINVKGCENEKLCELGIVTTSSVIIPKIEESSNITSFKASLKPLFKDYNLPALCGDEGKKNKLEYNISTRRIAVAEPSVIDIIPPGEIPGKQKRRYVDIIIPTVISMGTLFAGRALLAMFRDDATGFSMLAMMMTTSVSTMVTQTYNYFKQGRDNEQSIDEWQTNYEKYLQRIWDRIQEWQNSDINYLCTTYPKISELFENTKQLNRAIFARSQSDSDFLKITLGSSEYVEPMFEIKNEKKDQIFDDIQYRIHRDDKYKIHKTEDDGNIEIIFPKKKKKKNSTAEQNTVSEDSTDSIGFLSDLAYNLSTKEFRYLKKGGNGSFPPLVLNLKDCGVLGIVDTLDKYSEKFISHIVFEIAYYHTPEDVQFVFFFKEQSDEKKRMEMIKNYKNLPHANELFEDSSQFVFDKDSAAITFGKLQAIMSERTKESDDDEKVSQEYYTQIVCIMFDDYNIKETGFSKYLPKPPLEGQPYVNQNGLTFIFARKNLEQLPRYCGNIIEVLSTAGASSSNNSNVTEGQTSDAKVSSRYNILSRETLNSLSGSPTNQENTTNSIENLIDYKKFKNDYIFYNETEKESEYEEAFKRLSAIYYRRIAENGNVPSMVTLFQLYQYKTDMVENNKITDILLSNWKQSDVTRNLCIPIGKNEHGIVNLDLYEKADGPHMLVAGTTGSGKSETIITYLVGLCMKYSPTYLNLMLVDMKGGGFSNRLKKLPHCVGVVDDTAGESEGISAVYMLRRFLEVLNAEIKTRKILLNDFGVDNVDAYIRAERVISKILSEENNIKELKKSLNEAQTEELKQFRDNGTNPDTLRVISEILLKENNIKELEKSLNEAQKTKLAQFRENGTKPDTLSHLVLVVDEFTELKRFSSESDDIDFISEITTIARVGRTLGFHIILVSQNIEGAITEDIRINSKSRICLKVATRTASKEMLDGRPDAASPTMPGNGRAYLLVGTGSKFVYFQSAYTGANKDEKIEPVVSVTKVNACGNHNKNYYISTKHNDRVKNASKTANEYDTQLSYIVQTIEKIKEENSSKQQHYKIPRMIFKEPLKSCYIDPTEWRKP